MPLSFPPLPPPPPNSAVSALPPTCTAMCSCAICLRTATAPACCSRTELVKLSIISKNRVKQSDPRLVWMMFLKIAHMYRYIREQENEEATALILNLRANLNSNKTSFSSPITPKISIQQPTMPLDPKKYPKTSKKSSLVHPRFGIVMRSALIQIDHGLEWYVPTSSSQGNVCRNPKQDT